MRMTPKDSVDALRLMKKYGPELIQPDDDDDVKETIQGTVAYFIAGQREGAIAADVDFLDWYATSGDIEALQEASPDPTA